MRPGIDSITTPITTPTVPRPIAGPPPTPNANPSNVASGIGARVGHFLSGVGHAFENTAGDIIKSPVNLIGSIGNAVQESAKNYITGISGMGTASVQKSHSAPSTMPSQLATTAANKLPTYTLPTIEGDVSQTIHGGEDKLKVAEYGQPVASGNQWLQAAGKNFISKEVGKQIIGPAVDKGAEIARDSAIKGLESFSGQQGFFNPIINSGIYKNAAGYAKKTAEEQIKTPTLNAFPGYRIP